MTNSSTPDLPVIPSPSFLNILIGTSLEVGDGDLNTARGVVLRSRRDGGGAQAGVDTEDDPGQEAVLDVVTELDVVEERVGGAVGLGLGSDDTVVGIGEVGLGVGVVGVEQLDGVADGLVPEGLADVRGGQVVDGAVLTNGCVLVQNGVDVDGTAGVVAREEGVEGGDALLVGGLQAAEEGLVEHRRVLCVAVAGVGCSRVDAGGVAAEDLEVGADDGLAGLQVDDLEVVVDGDTLLVVDEILTDVLAGDVVGATLSLRSQNAGGVRSKDICLRGVEGEASVCGVVVGGKDSGQITGLDVALLYQFVPLVGTALNGAVLKPTSLELCCAVVEVARSVLEHSPAHSDLLVKVSVGGDDSSSHSTGNDSRVTHFGSDFQ